MHQLRYGIKHHQANQCSGNYGDGGSNGKQENIYATNKRIVQQIREYRQQIGQ